MRISALARPEIRALQPYSIAPVPPLATRMHANEAIWYDEREDVSNARFYPEITATTLAQKLAGWYGVANEQLLVTRGSSEAIDLLIRSFCRPAVDAVVQYSPTFEMYRVYAQIQGATVIDLPLDAEREFAVDPAMLPDSRKNSIKLIFLCSPNNPSGNAIDRTTMTEILRLAQGRALVVVDEAYVEFSDSGSVLDLRDEFDHLIVLRTLSKAFGLAGVRCGCVVAHPDVIRLLGCVQSPYAISTPVTDAVLGELAELTRAKFADRIGEVVQQRQWLATQLGRLPIVRRTWRSDANFILAQFKRIDAVRQATVDAGILLRHFPAGELRDCARITVGSKKQNEALFNVLQTIEAKQ